MTTPRERVLAAIAHEPAERIPYHVEFTAGAHRRLAQYFGDPAFDRKIGNHMAVTKALPAGYPRQLKPGFIQDDFGVVWDRTVDETCGLPQPILNEPDLAGFEFPDPRDPSRFAHFAAFERDHADRFRVLKLSHALFERAWAMRGLAPLLMDFYTAPDFAQELLSRITEHNLALLEQARGRNIDAVWFGDDWGSQQGLMMSPELWRAMLKPHFERMAAKARENGWIVMIHCCGAVEELLPELIELGVQVFNPFQPEVMDVFAVKKKYGRNLTFFGGLSIQGLLPFGAPADVRRQTRRLIGEIGAGGGYILSPAHALPHDVPPANLLAMLEEAQTFSLA